MAHQHYKSHSVPFTIMAAKATKAKINLSGIYRED